MKKLYYIRSHERGYVGNSPVWWRANRMGYTFYLNEAGKYIEEEAIDICKQSNVIRVNESMWLCEEVDNHARRVFDGQDFQLLSETRLWEK